MYLIWYILSHFARGQHSNFRYSADVSLVSSPHSFVFLLASLWSTDEHNDKYGHVRRSECMEFTEFIAYATTRLRDEYRLFLIRKDWKTWHMIFVSLLAYIPHDLSFSKHVRCICIVLLFKMIRPRQLWIILQCSMWFAKINNVGIYPCTAHTHAH